MAVLMVRIDATADDSLAAMRARSKFGIAIAAMIRMIATTISSSISEKPFCLRILKSFSLLKFAARIGRLLFSLHARCHDIPAADWRIGVLKMLVFNGTSEILCPGLEKSYVWLTSSVMVPRIGRWLAKADSA